MSIELYTGPMCSGKSEKMQEDIRKAKIARKSVYVFNHEINARDKEGALIKTRDGHKTEAITIASARELAKVFQEEARQVVAIEEVQFFDEEIVPVARWLSECKAARVIMAGLDLDFRREPFGSMPLLLEFADKVNKLTAICMKCYEEPARYTQRLVNGQPAHWDDPIVLVGDVSEGYEARCGDCHEVRGRPTGIIYAGLPV